MYYLHVLVRLIKRRVRGFIYGCKWQPLYAAQKDRGATYRDGSYLLVHRKDPAEDNITIDAYQLRAVLASLLCVVTFARDQEAPHPRQDLAQAHLDHRGGSVQRFAVDTSLKHQIKHAHYYANLSSLKLTYQ